MKQRGIYLIIGLIVLAIIATAIYYTVVAEKNIQQGHQSSPERGKILVVVYPYFRWEEYYNVYKVLTAAGYRVDTICMSNRSTLFGVDLEGRLHKIECKMHIPFRLNYSQYSAIVFIGGPGLYCILDYYAHTLGIAGLDKYCIKLLGSYIYESRQLLNYGSTLAEKMYQNGRIVAAICVSPVILCMAHVLHGKEYTMFRCSVTEKLMKYLGCTRFINKPVIVVGRIVTGSGPSAAKMFADTVLHVLERYGK